MSSVSIRNIVKKYPGGVLAVTDLSLEINDGAFVVLVGPSGCGKSTLLRMIAGLEKITSGEIRIDDEPVTRLEPGERNIAMVFQNYALYPHMSVKRNLEYGLRNEGLPKSEREVRINRAANMLHIEELLNRKPRELSGGQRQRVAMGRAIVREPRVFLFDEPLSNLDAKLRTELRAELKKLHRELSGTFLFVTHDQLEAMSLADQIVVMNQGRIEQTGSPMELYSDPNSLFVAEFIGNTGCNLIQTTCMDNQTLNLNVPDTQLQLVLRDEALKDLHLNENSLYTVAVRPEHLIIDKPSNTGLNARIILMEQLGADTMLHCALEGAEDNVLICRAPGSLSITEGAAVSLLPGAGQLMIFDTKTGARIRAL